MTTVARAVAIGCWSLLALLVQAGAAPAQTFRGVGSCGGSECHSRSGEVDWLGNKPGGKEHRESLRRLKSSLDVSEKYAKAVGLDNVFAPKGMCLKCHGTFVDAAKTTEGVGCEGCHGAGGGYRDFHQNNPKDYSGAVSRGLRDLKGKPTAWTRVCTDCHVLDKKPEYDVLIEAGHKDGSRWRPQNKYAGVQAHWKRVSYTVEVITAAAAGKPVTVAVAASPADPAPAAATPEPTRPAPPSAAGPPPTPPAVVQAPGQVRPPASRGSAGGFAIAPVPGTAGAPPPGPPADPPPAITSSPLSLQAPAPVSASEILAALQGRVAGFLTRLLASGMAPDVPLKPLPAPATVEGPDAELLRLQAEALALAIQALNLKVNASKPIPDK